MSSLNTKNNVRNKSFAYDLAINVIDKGEVFDDQAINVSIQNILSTLFGQRLFIPNFGSSLPLILFENINESNAQDIYNNIISAIETWETRIVVDKKNSFINVLVDQNALELNIQYYIKRTNVLTTFKRKVLL